MRHILRQIASAIGVLTSLCRGSRSANILQLQPSCLPVLSPFVIAAFAAAANLLPSLVLLLCQSCLRTRRPTKKVSLLSGVYAGVFFWGKLLYLSKHVEIWVSGHPPPTHPPNHPHTHTHNCTQLHTITQLSTFYILWYHRQDGAAKGGVPAAAGANGSVDWCISGWQ